MSLKNCSRMDGIYNGLKLRFAIQELGLNCLVVMNIIIH